VQLSTQHAKDQEHNRDALLHIIRALKYLARQGLAFRGDEEWDGNFYQLLLLMSKDCPALAKWLQKRGSYTSHDIQNEIISLIYHSVMRSILSKISASRFFSLIIDGGSDAGFVEQISICFR